MSYKPYNPVYLIGEVEDKLVAEFALRLNKGLAQYGAWPVEEKRELIREAVEEALDLNAYLLKKLADIERAERVLREKEVVGAEPDYPDSGPPTERCPAPSFEEDGRDAHCVPARKPKRKGNAGGKAKLGGGAKRGGKASKRASR